MSPSIAGLTQPAISPDFGESPISAVTEASSGSIDMIESPPYSQSSPMDPSHPYIKSSPQGDAHSADLPALAPPPARRRLHTAEEPIVASPLTGGASVPLGGESSTANKSFEIESQPFTLEGATTTASHPSRFKKVHTLSPEMIDRLSQERAQPDAAPPPLQEYLHSPEYVQPVHQPAPQQTENINRREHRRSESNKRIAPFRRSSVSSLSYDDFVTQQSSTIPSSEPQHHAHENHRGGMHQRSSTRGSGAPQQHRSQSTRRPQQQPQQSARPLGQRGGQGGHSRAPEQRSTSAHRAQRERAPRRRAAPTRKVPHRESAQCAALLIQSSWRGWLARRYYAWLLRRERRKKKQHTPGATRHNKEPKPTRRAKPTALNQQFNELDTNRDGKISRAEWMHGARNDVVRLPDPGRCKALEAAALGWRTRRIMALPVVSDIMLEIKDTKNVISDMKQEKSPDSFLLARLEAQLRTKQDHLSGWLADARWVQIASQRPRKASSSLAPKKGSMLRRGEGAGCSKRIVPPQEETRKRAGSKELTPPPRAERAPSPPIVVREKSEPRSPPIPAARPAQAWEVLHNSSLIVDAFSEWVCRRMRWHCLRARPPRPESPRSPSCSASPSQSRSSQRRRRAPTGERVLCYGVEMV